MVKLQCINRWLLFFFHLLAKLYSHILERGVCAFLNLRIVHATKLSGNRLVIIIPLFFFSKRNYPSTVRHNGRYVQPQSNCSTERFSFICPELTTFGTELDFNLCVRSHNSSSAIYISFPCMFVKNLHIHMSRPVVGAWYFNILICSRGVAVSDDCFGLSIMYEDCWLCDSLDAT
jgi:hypothetical protein